MKPHLIDLPQLQRNLPEIRRALNQHRLIIFPSDTVYGICCLARSLKAQRRLYHAKGRDRTKRLQVLFSSLQMLERYCLLDSNEQAFARRWFPGQVSMILRLREPLSPLLKETICARIPDHQTLRQLVEQSGPMIATSLNASSKPIITELQNCPPRIFHRCAWIIREGILGSIPTTIIRLNDGQLEILRDGFVARSTLEA